MVMEVRITGGVGFFKRKNLHINLQTETKPRPQKPSIRASAHRHVVAHVSAHKQTYVTKAPQQGPHVKPGGLRPSVSAQASAIKGYFDALEWALNIIFEH